MKTADEIYESFKENWKGSDSELDRALHDFYTDIRHSFIIAIDITPRMKVIFNTVDDYVGNHYFS